MAGLSGRHRHRRDLGPRGYVVHEAACLHSRARTAGRPGSACWACRPPQMPMKPDTLEAPCDGYGRRMEMAGSCRERAVHALTVTASPGRRAVAGWFIARPLASASSSVRPAVPGTQRRIFPSHPTSVTTTLTRTSLLRIHPQMIGGDDHRRRARARPRAGGNLQSCALLGDLPRRSRDGPRPVREP